MITTEGLDVLQVNKSETIQLEHTIIIDVLTNGLQSSSRLQAKEKPYLKSGDLGLRDVLDGRSWSTTDGEDILFDCLYGGGVMSVIGVMMERHDQIKPPTDSNYQLTDVARRRALANILVICDDNEIRQMSRSGEIPSVFFQAVFIPDLIYGRNIGTIPPEILGRCFSVPTTKIIFDVWRDGKKYLNNLSVPDYKTSILKWIDNQDRRIWFTGVRTPLA